MLKISPLGYFVLAGVKIKVQNFPKIYFNWILIESIREYLFHMQYLLNGVKDCKIGLQTRIIKIKMQMIS